jgi:AraC-like DNA-binding protein
MNKIPVRKITSPKTQPGGEKFSIRELQHLLNGKSLIHDLHRHDFFFILALQNGTGVHEIDFNPYEVTDHSLFILRPGQVHRLELSADSNGFLMEFDPGFYKAKNIHSVQRWKKAAARNFCKVSEERFSKLYSLLGNILNEHTNKQDNSADAILAYLDLFFIEYVRQSRNPKPVDQGDSDYIQDRFDEFIQVLESNIGSIKNVSVYAQLLNLSSYQLNAITKAAVGKTVSDLVNEQIILEAKRHLLATTNQVKDIADHLGYEDGSYFIRFFKKHTGYTPDSFRKNFK